MKLSTKSNNYIIPEYSLTGDLLSFLTCNLQYRYQNKGTLPPSMPIQLWFGEFIHGVMEEAFLRWKVTKKEFPWDWKEDIRPIEDMIDLRLQVRGLYPPKELFFSTNSPDNTLSLEDLNEKDHKKLASARACEAINIWGKDLFPLLKLEEHLIKGIRAMPNYGEHSRSDYYGITGIVDVLSSDQIEKQTKLDYFDNKITKLLLEDKNFKDSINKIKNESYEIIIDYKGMKRPSKNDLAWKHHKQQILTYAWLRSRQEDSKPVIIGIIFYLNELVPSYEDLQAMQLEIENESSDVIVGPEDYEKIMNWDETKEYPHLSDELKQRRSFRLINIDSQEIYNALEEFDEVVENIEKSIIKEIEGSKIKEAWKAEADERTCNACDFRSFCGNEKIKKTNFKVP